MILSGYHVVEDLKELWGFKSFRARIFLAAFPTLVALIFGHFATDRQRPYDFHGEESYIVPPEGRGGDQITVNWKVTHHRTCPGVVQRQLVDPRTNVILAVYDPAPAALNGVDVGGGFLRKTFMIPRSIQSGDIGYKAQLTYTCNWLQAFWPVFAIRYETPTILFRVEE